MEFGDLSFDAARRHLGAVFRLALNDGSSLELVLADVTELPTGPAESAPTSFSLHFRGPAGPILDQGSYGLISGDLEPQPVFIVPMASDRDSTTYEAIFTRL
jgi:hypothetical protein